MNARQGLLENEYALEDIPYYFITSIQKKNHVNMHYFLGIALPWPVGHCVHMHILFITKISLRVHG